MYARVFDSIPENELKVNESKFVRQSKEFAMQNLMNG